MEVTVPPAFASAAQAGTPPVTFNTCPVDPMPNLDNAVVLDAYNMSPTVYAV